MRSGEKSLEAPLGGTWRSCLGIGEIGALVGWAWAFGSCTCCARGLELGHVAYDLK